MSIKEVKSLKNRLADDLICGDRNTIRRLASFLDCTETAVTQYMTGVTFPKTERLIKIAEYFGCSLDYLVGFSDIRTPDADTQAIGRILGLSEESIERLRTLSNSDTDRILSLFLDTVEAIRNEHQR